MIALCVYCVLCLYSIGSFATNIVVLTFLVDAAVLRQAGVERVATTTTATKGSKVSAKHKPAEDVVMKAFIRILDALDAGHRHIPFRVSSKYNMLHTRAIVVEA